MSDFGRCPWCGGLADTTRPCPHARASRRYGGMLPIPPDEAISLRPRDEPVGPRYGPLELIGMYLTWHMVAVCDGRCVPCQDAYEYLAGQGALPRDAARILADPSRRRPV